MAQAKRPENYLLRRLSGAEYAAIEGDLDLVEIAFKEPLYSQEKPITHVYFPTSGVVSLVREMEEDGWSVECGTIGREGLVGIPAFLGAKRAPGRAFVQVPGFALRMETPKFQAAARRSEKLRSLLMLYANALMSMIAQTAACNRSHPVEARMARWLLMTHDRVDGPDFPLTQDFLGQMLGVRRPSVNGAGRHLQSRKLIKYTRGRITILDRAGLEKMSCECYAQVAKQMKSIGLGPR
jgi:CRP-like cAMP-binding protein